jgi:hypothetical protein
MLQHRPRPRPPNSCKIVSSALPQFSDHWVSQGRRSHSLFLGHTGCGSRILSAGALEDVPFCRAPGWRAAKGDPLHAGGVGLAFTPAAMSSSLGAMRSRRCTGLIPSGCRRQRRLVSVAYEPTLRELHAVVGNDTTITACREERPALSSEAALVRARMAFVAGPATTVQAVVKYARRPSGVPSRDSCRTFPDADYIGTDRRLGLGQWLLLLARHGWFRTIRSRDRSEPYAT